MKSHLIVGFGALIALTGSAGADTVTGDQVRSAVTGNTVQGSMDASGRYTEFYGSDGVVHGKDYKAAWSVEGDRMCWIYEGSPKDCWNAEITGDQVTWIKDGKAQGTGTLIKGNPNNF